MRSVAASMGAAMVDHGLRRAFAVLGEGNLEWTAAATAAGVDVVQARHEGNALAMADGGARASDDVGVASVTCGPGLTQAATALVTSARSASGVIVFTGDTPASPATPRDRAQRMDQERFALALGCDFVRAEAPEDGRSAVARAYQAAREHRTVVLSCPTDVQRALVTDPDQDPSHDRPDPRATARRTAPVPTNLVDRAVESIRGTRSPFVLVGRGAASAESAVCALADRMGAVIGTTMPAKGVAASSPGHVGVVGGYGAAVLPELTAEVDLVVAVGTSLTSETLADGTLFPRADLLHVNLDAPVTPHPWASVLHLPYDAAAVLEQLIERLPDAPSPAVSAWRDRAARTVQEALAAEVDGDPLPQHEGTVDPRAVVRAFARELPEDAVVVSCVGHFGVLPPRHVPGAPAQRWVLPYDFGAIGQGISFGIGAALATRRPTVVFEGDGGAMMNVQELDTARRTGASVAVVVMNDHALGAEYHELLRRGHDPELAAIPTPSFADLAEAFGVRGRTVTHLDDVPAVGALIRDRAGPVVIDVRLNPEIRRRSLRWARGYARV